MPFTEKGQQVTQAGVAVPVQSLVIPANTVPVTEGGCGCENYGKLIL